MLKLLCRSAELEAALLNPKFVLHPGDSSEQSARIAVSYCACCVSFEHSRALRLLIKDDCQTSAIAMMRLQYEALVRSTWAMYAATDLAITKLDSALNIDTELAAKNLPTLSKMLKELDGKGPAVAVMMLVKFKMVMVSALNSFVHGGIHAVQRIANGYPEELLLQVIRSSTALLTMAGAMLAILSGDQSRMKVISGYQTEFRDCLPDLLKPV